VHFADWAPVLLFHPFVEHIAHKLLGLAYFFVQESVSFNCCSTGWCGGKFTEDVRALGALGTSANDLYGCWNSWTVEHSITCNICYCSSFPLSALSDLHHLRIHWPVITDAQVQSQACPRGVCSGQSAPYSFFHLSLTLIVAVDIVTK
jgi:hypothetical protein